MQERLPKNPLVVQPVETAGKYGGVWRTGLLSTAGYNAVFTRTIGYDYLVRWDLTWKQVVPNVAESFQTSPDARTFTFKLREGLKWSDGQPYTADDLVFSVEDISKNKELTSSRGANPPEIEQVDRHTVRITFAQPNGLFLQNLASPNGDAWTRYPAHYLKQFHQKYNTTTLDQLVKDAGVKDWVELFRTKGAGIPGTPYDARWQNKDLPTLNAWMLTTPYGGNVTRVVADRNPYYYKVDPAGAQLPYLDRVTYEVAQEAEVLTLKALNGEIDLQNLYIATNQNKAVFADNQQKGGYRFFETIPAGMNDAIIALNLTHKDPVKRQIFQNKDFRIGLSHAIDRQQIIDVVFVSQGEPWQAGPRRESEFFNERLAKQYTEYDPTRANAALDRAFPQKDGQGFRLGPDGKRITFQVELSSTSPSAIDALNLVRDHWLKVGIDAQIKPVDRGLMYSRKDANEHDAVIWAGDGGLDVLLEPRFYFPYSTESNFAQAWTIWWTKQSNPLTAPEEPPDAPKRQMALYDQLKATGDAAKQGELMKQILQIAQEEFYVIGLSLPANGYGIVKSTLRNVPKAMFNAWLWPTPAPTNPEQYFHQ